MKQENFILALSSPSGAGKTSIARKILESDPKFVTSISVTTRPKRPSEIDGRDYFFVTKEKFKSMKEQDQLLEDAMVHGNYYGSPKQYVLEMLSQDHDVIFDIDWQGTHSLKEKLGSIVISIFILPPSLSELEARLKTRGEDSEEVINQRMANAKDEILHYNEYDYVLINNDFDKTLDRVRKIIEAERLRHFNFSKFVEKIMS